MKVAMLSREEETTPILWKLYSKLVYDLAASLDHLRNSMDSQKKESFDREENENKRDRSDSFVVEMDNLSNCADKDNKANLRIDRLQRNLSRKGSQRWERKSSAAERDVSGGVVDVASGLPKGGCSPDKSVAVHIPLMETADPIANAQLQQAIQTNAENKSRRRNNKQRSAWIDPWQILFIFATLSIVGSIILIYITLSMVKHDNSND